MQQPAIIGKIKKVPLRKIWNKEDKDFTKWLEENIDYLNEILDFDIAIERSEEKVGPFKVDLYGEDNNGNKVIIENQLEKTDHDHLGKLMTYLINLEASIAIWITSKPVDEHTKVIEWLNEVTPDDIYFYLIKIEAIKIEPQTVAAPLFTIIKGPSTSSKKIGEERKEYAQRHILRREFWTKLLEKARTKTKLHSNVSPNIYSWIGTGAGKSGIGYYYSITNKRASTEIYLDAGPDYVEPNLNEQRFDELFQHKDRIEEDLGFQLEWERLEGRRASRIIRYFSDAGLKNEEKWDDLQEKMINSMIKIEKVFSKYIIKLK